MENEIMNVEEVMEEAVVMNEGTGLGKAVVVVAGVAAVGFAAYRLGKMVYGKIKNKKNEIVIEPETSNEDEEKND